MTTDKNIQDLVHENTRLLAENTQFRDFIIRVASMKTYGEWIDEFGTTSNLKETAILLLGGYQAPQAIAPKPKFKVGDKVRGKSHSELGFYKEGQFDTIENINEYGGIQLRYYEDDGVSDTTWAEDDLLPYNPD